MNAREKKFVELVWTYYEKSGRHDLPWRKNHNPYPILVSEVMLQQTQAQRVIPKYQAFLKQFPNIQALASAPLKEVLIAWQGLGYNRRAKNLQAAAQTIITDYMGRFPRSYEEIIKLSGVGPYTSGAIMAFAYNEARPLIETNLRTVYLHHFYKDTTDVSDKELLVVIERTLDTNRPRDWYYALMDYGAHLKSTIGNENVRAKTYSKQSTFNGSDRQIRGAIVRMLATKSSLTRLQLHKALAHFDMLRIDVQLARLTEEGLLCCIRGKYSLPD